MPDAYQRLVAAWRHLDLSSKPYLLEGDDALREGHRSRSLIHKHGTFEDHISDPDFDVGDGRLLHPGLIPIPYVGDLQTARIYILMLNPGFCAFDYFAEDISPEFRQALTSSLRQERRDEPYPMIYLDPRFAWHSGAEYWTSKFKSILDALRNQFKISYAEALRRLSKQIACIEYIPYHSRHSGMPRAVLKKLLSPKLILDYVHETLVPRAIQGEATIIVTRYSKLWALPQHPNIVVYSASESRGAHLTLKSPGGRKMAEFLGLNQSCKPV